MVAQRSGANFSPGMVRFFQNQYVFRQSGIELAKMQGCGGSSRPGADYDYFFFTFHSKVLLGISVPDIGFLTSLIRIRLQGLGMLIAPTGFELIASTAFTRR